MKIQCSYTNEHAFIVCVGSLDFHYIWSSWCLLNSKVTHMIQRLHVGNVPAATENSLKKPVDRQTICPFSTKNDQPRTGTSLQHHQTPPVEWVHWDLLIPVWLVTYVLRIWEAETSTRAGTFLNFCCVHVLFSICHSVSSHLNIHYLVI